MIVNESMTMIVQIVHALLHSHSDSDSDSHTHTLTHYTRLHIKQIARAGPGPQDTGHRIPPRIADHLVAVVSSGLPEFRTIFRKVLNRSTLCDLDRLDRSQRRQARGRAAGPVTGSPVAGCRTGPHRARRAR